MKEIWTKTSKEKKTIITICHEWKQTVYSLSSFAIFLWTKWTDEWVSIRILAFHCSIFKKKNSFDEHSICACLDDRKSDILFLYVVRQYSPSHCKTGRSLRVTNVIVSVEKHVVYKQIWHTIAANRISESQYWITSPNLKNESILNHHESHSNQYICSCI